MQRWTKLRQVAVLALVTLTIAGCDKPTLDERPPEPGDVAVARIDGHTIWASDVRYEAVQQGLIGDGEPFDLASPLFRRTLEEVIDQKLLAQAALKKGIDRTELAQRRIAAAREDILGHMLLEQSVDASIDDKKVKDLYDEQVKLAQKSEEIRARLILVKTRPEADNVMRQLQGGSLFEAMAMERSIDQATRFNGGDMGYFTTDVIPESYRAALMTAKPGQIAGPVQIDGGWAVFKVEERRPEQPMTIEEARPGIVSALKLEQVRGLLGGLRDGARVEFLVKGLSSSEDREPASAPAGASASSASGSEAADDVGESPEKAAASATSSRTAAKK
ncbi:peptidylprolyl isomerase [Asticcacaulis sp.]|jgi:peptidyl-prolyl cis-trans isomerase C|uniref:peptidylprolyl isomerase n=1 Tax=unclassified Asticcacaulis TaxID=2628350 RepID=UPI0025BA0541|nr:peptidylprolyl isomerase [Asticcacaulis sp.]MCA1935887.1 peptidyl-prolyl cis-trans isomerase [Asticcacaulis sp.]